MDSVVIIVSILPGGRGTGKDAVFAGTISDIAEALGLRGGTIVVLGQPSPRPEWVYSAGADWRVIELAAPKPHESVLFMARRLLAGHRVTLSQALFLSQRVAGQVNAILDAADCSLAIFDTIRTYDDAIAVGRRRVVFFDDLFSERFSEQAREPDRAQAGVLGRYTHTAPLWSRLLRPPWLARAALLAEARLCRAKEAYVARHASASVLLNENEQSRLAQRTGVPVHCYIPRIVTAAKPVKAAAAGGYWLFVGAMDYIPNTDGMRWLTDAILPRYRAAGGHLPVRVVGKNCPTELIEKIDANGGEYLGYVDDLAAQYGGATGVLMPILSGAGIKVKCLEALSFGCLTVGTDRAYDGLESLPEAAMRADTPAGFADAMLEAERQVETANTARADSIDWFEAKFGPARLGRLRQILVA